MKDFVHNYFLHEPTEERIPDQKSGHIMLQNSVPVNDKRTGTIVRKSTVKIKGEYILKITHLLTLVADPGEISLSIRRLGVCPSVGVALNT